MRVSHVFRIASILAAALTAVGCSGGSGLRYDAIISQMIPLEGRSFSTQVSGAGAVRIGSGTFSVSFDDRPVTDAARFRTIEVTESLDDDVTLTLPSGASPPASFELRNLDLTQIQVYDTSGTRLMTRRAFAEGPIRFDRVGSTDTYRATSDVRIEFTTPIDGTDLDTLLAVVQQAPADNFCGGHFNYEVSDSVPAESTIGFTFGRTTGTVRLD